MTFAKTFRVSALAVAALTMATIAQAASLSGVWRSPDDNGEIEFYDCQGKLCGRLVGSDHLKTQPDLTDLRNTDPTLRARALKGLPIVLNLSGGPTSWRGGKLYRPLDGHTYAGSLDVVNDQTLKVTGCVFVGLCDTQTWVRVR